MLGPPVNSLYYLVYNDGYGSILSAKGLLNKSETYRSSPTKVGTRPYHKTFCPFLRQGLPIPVLVRRLGQSANKSNRQH